MPGILAARVRDHAAQKILESDSQVVESWLALSRMEYTKAGKSRWTITWVLMMGNRKHLAIGFFAVAAIALTAWAHETDQFTLPQGRAFADLGGYFNVWAYDTIERGASRVNGRIRRCLNEHTSASELAALQSPRELVTAVNLEFPAAYDVIEGLERTLMSRALTDRYPGKIVSYRQQLGNIYQHVHFPLDPRQIFRLWHASTMMIYGTYVGTDKIGHFTDMGIHYYKAYTAAKSKGADEQAALTAAVAVGTTGPIFSERGLVGYFSAGDYSNGDLIANYLGLLFYLNLTEPVMIKGKLQPPMLVRDGEYWKIAPHVRRDSDFFAVFICDHLDEALNPGLFEAAMRSAIRDAVKERGSAILARRCDRHGNRRPREHFDAILEECKTYYGQDYGHEGTPADLITIGNTCFEPVPREPLVTARDSSGSTPLHLAAAAGDLAVVKRLVQQGADVNAAVRSAERYSSEWGNTPLHLAARDGRLEIVEFLISAGADVNAGNNRGETPLHRALAHRPVMSALIRHGARLNAADNTGATALHWVAGDGLADAVQLLLDAGADANLRDNTGMTPLHCAAKYGNSNVATKLLGRGVDVNARAALGVAPLHLAAASGNTALVDLLLANRCDIRAKDEFGWTALHEAADKGRADVAEFLLARVPEPGPTDAHGTTPLHLAVRRGRAGIAQLLLAKGAPVNARNSLGMTPLHEATSTGDTELATLLMQQGADVSVRNAQGLTPPDLAFNRGFRDLAATLRTSRPLAPTNGRSAAAVAPTSPGTR